MYGINNFIDVYNIIINYLENKKVKIISNKIVLFKYILSIYKTPFCPISNN